jgi:hypothetical protein
METKKPAVVLAFALMSGALPLQAHHGTAGTYDQTKIVKVAGVVKEFHWHNPHCILVITGKDASGKPLDYSFEIGGPAGLARQGFSKKSFKAGDTIAFNMHPSFNNPAVGQPASRLFVVNGKEMKGVGGGDEP